MHNDRRIVNLALIGFMGTGKTSVGRLVAEQLHFDFLDTDELIQSHTGRSITDIFATDGEPAFRALEQQVVAELATRERTVIATGGGLPANPENLASLKTHALVVCLWASPEKIWERVRNQTHRPLLHDADPQKKIRELLAAREPFYKQADVLINTDMRSPAKSCSRSCISSVPRKPATDEGEPSASARWNWVLTTAASPPPPPPAKRGTFQDWLAAKAITAKWRGSNATRQSGWTRKRFCPARKASSPGGELCGGASASCQSKVPRRFAKAVRAYSGLVARYARFDDYHDVLGERLKSLAQFVNDLAAPARPLALVCGHRAGAGTRLRAARRTRLRRQAHQPHQPPTRQLDFSCGNFDDAGTRTGRAGEKSLRQMFAAASPPARPTPSPRHFNWTRASAFPT